jgi:hypothetical protein
MTHGLPATSGSVTVFVVSSGPGTGSASGTAPGHIGICVWPKDGCQAAVWAFRLPNANTIQNASSVDFITIPLIESEAEGLAITTLTGSLRLTLSKRATLD